MRRYLYAVLILLLLVSSAFAAMKNEPDGYGGVKWGDPLEKHSTTLKVLEKSGNTSLCTNVNESLTFGGARLTSVVYHFGTAGFTAVDIFFDLQGKAANETPLYRESVRRWGAPTSIRVGQSVGNEYTWSGDNVICVIANVGNGKGKLSISHN